MDSHSHIQNILKNNVQFSLCDFDSTTKTSDPYLLVKYERNEINCGFIEAIICDSSTNCHLVAHVACMPHVKNVIKIRLKWYYFNCLAID